MQQTVRTNGGICIEGAATVRACDGDSLRGVEGKVWLLGESYDLLKAHLQATIDALPEYLNSCFYPGEFQFERKRWCSDDGMFALQWRRRDDPSSPISEDNRQAAAGITDVVTLLDEAEFQPAQYVGPWLNPNGTEDEDEWWHEALETGEKGLAYQDDLGRWRFKRVEGSVGYRVEESHVKVKGTPSRPSRIAQQARPKRSRRASKEGEAEPVVAGQTE